MKSLVRLTVGVLALLLVAPAISGEFDKPWKERDVSFVLDAYEFTPILWERLKENRNLVGFINKASDGLPPKYRCPSRNSLCGVKWRRYAVTKELYHTRRALAKSLGLKWGAYHLARPGNPIQQAQHFLRFAQPTDDELIALDIEDNSDKWMSLSDAETFARYIKARTGRYPVLYTNHNTSRFIARNKHRYKLLSRLNLWYARYRPSMPKAFPMGQWDSYSLWQFSTMVNCSRRRCPHRIKGTDHMIDVNVAYMKPDKLRAAWPFAKLTAREHQPEGPPLPLVVAKTDEVVKVAKVAGTTPDKPASTEPVQPVAAKPAPTVIPPKAKPATHAAINSVAPLIAASFAPESTQAYQSTLLAALKSPSYAAEIRRMWVRNPPLPTWRPVAAKKAPPVLQSRTHHLRHTGALQHMVLPAERFATISHAKTAFLELRRKPSFAAGPRSVFRRLQRRSMQPL